MNVSANVFDKIPEYEKILNDLSKGNLKANFSLSNRKSKLSHSLNDILFDEKNDELSYFVLFMDTKNASNYVKFLLDLNNFQQTFKLKASNSAPIKLCPSCCNLSASSSSLSRSSPTPKISSYESFKIINYDCTDCYRIFVQNVAQDALSIFSKYISKDASYSIHLSDELIRNTISNICPENDQTLIEPDCFNSSRDYAYNYIQENFYDKYLVSEYHCKYLLNILETQNLTLADFLYDDIAVVYLLEFLENEKVRDLLKFWIQAENFSRNLLANKPTNTYNAAIIESYYKQWQNDAIIIYDNYISLQAKSSLGFDTLVRLQVESNICQVIDGERDDLDYLVSSYANCFYVPMLIVFSILEKVYFKKFLNSYLYKNYIKEIVSNSEIGLDEAPQISKRERKMNNRIHNEASVINDDPLWAQRSQENKMQLGMIDSTGRFIRNFKSEPDDTLNGNDKTPLGIKDCNDNTNHIYTDDIWSLSEEFNSKTSSTSNKVKSKLNKLINLMPFSNSSLTSKTIAEEQEMAEKLAAMLVNDVIRQNQLI